MGHAKKRQRIERLYAKLPKLQCKGLCHESCGPIAMSQTEARVIEEQRGGAIPQCNGEDCPLLTSDYKCSVYAVRPMICRLWGLVRDMRCPFGCEPDRWLSHHDGQVLLRELGKIDPEVRWLAFEQPAGALDA